MRNVLDFRMITKHIIEDLTEGEDSIKQKGEELKNIVDEIVKGELEWLNKYK